MNYSTRSKIFPKNRHLGFKRPVFVEPVKEDNDFEEVEEDKKIDKEEQLPPQKIVLNPLSFNISLELLLVPDDTPQTPTFDWIDSDSDKFENPFSQSVLLFDDPDIIESLNDFDIKLDPVF